MALEIELKLLVPPTWVSEVQQGLAAFLQSLDPSCQLNEPESLLNAYFETEQQWFRQQDAGLRTRFKRGRYEQTLKLKGQQQGAAHIRPEFNVPCDSVRPDLTLFPAKVWPASTDVQQLQQQLVELFRTDFQRQAAVVQYQGSVIEVVFDQGHVQADAQVEAIAEIELELQQGDVAPLFALAHTLVQQWPLLAGSQSKAERGYRLRNGTPLRWQTGQTVGHLVRAFYTNQLLVSRQQATTEELEAHWQQLVQALWLEQSALAREAELALTLQQRQHWLLTYTQSQLVAPTAI